MTTKISQKNAKKFVCENCDFKSCNKYDYNRHLSTVKHKNNTTTTNDNDILAKTSKIYDCDNCDKKFNDRAGLWRHKKKCINEVDNLKNDLPNEEKQQQLVEYLLKENSEFKSMLFTTLQEQNKQMR